MACVLCLCVLLLLLCLIACLVCCMCVWVSIMFSFMCCVMCVSCMHVCLFRVCASVCCCVFDIVWYSSLSLLWRVDCLLFFITVGVCVLGVLCCAFCLRVFFLCFVIVCLFDVSVWLCVIVCVPLCS